MTVSDPAGQLAAIATELQARPAQDVTTRAIVDHALELLEPADHASLTVRWTRHEHRTLAATSTLAESLDQAQYSLGQGPCLEAADVGEWYRSGEVGTDDRWPTWGPTAADLGVQSLLSVRLLARGEPYGAINLYSESAKAFDDPDVLALGLVYAVHAANALDSSRLVTGLETALTSRHEIGVAQGILMERYGLDIESAFAALRRVSQHSNTTLRDVASEVVRTGRLPSEGRGDLTGPVRAPPQAGTGR